MATARIETPPPPVANVVLEMTEDEAKALHTLLAYVLPREAGLVLFNVLDALDQAGVDWVVDSRFEVVDSHGLPGIVLHYGAA